MPSFTNKKRQAHGQIPKPPHEDRLGMPKKFWALVSWVPSQRASKHASTRHETSFVEYYFGPLISHFEHDHFTIPPTLESLKIGQALDNSIQFKLSFRWKRVISKYLYIKPPQSSKSEISS